MDEEYTVIAYYLFSEIKDPKFEVLRHKSFCEGRDIRGRIYISEEGINGQMSASNSDAQAYMAWMKSHAPFEEIEFKCDLHSEHVFEKLTVKYREQLVALDSPVNMGNIGEYLEPSQWEKMIDNEEKILIDVRNDYEWQVGRFKGAETPQCESFREFKKYAEELKNRIDPNKTPVMMYCTGGIRCEVYSAFLKERGFKKIYQLKGGVINYGQKQGSKHWLGKLFVFDDRMTTSISSEKTEVIGKCHRCKKDAENYYNCANMDCNFLFLCCHNCLEELSGCCKKGCIDAPRVRPYHHQNPHKPFRKWYQYFKGKVKVAK